jgi:carbon monoxide dehydrogenase subunit G
MKLAGKHMLNATPAQVWKILMDAGSLARVVPGISKLEKISDNAYRSTLNIGLGPVSGSFNGHIQLDNIIEEESFTLKAKQESKIGNANATIGIRLLPANNEQTTIDFDGEVQLSGLVASMGQRIIGGVSGTLTKQFFQNLEKELNVSG